MSKQPQRSFSTDLKVRLIRRIEAGEQLSAVADEMGIRRKLLYEWRAAYRALGAAGLNRKRGPKPESRNKVVSSRGRASPAAASGADVAPASTRPRDEGEVDELARAKARIDELERVIGRQQTDLHFFQEALRLWDAESRNGAAPISTASSKK